MSKVITESSINFNWAKSPIEHAIQATHLVGVSALLNNRLNLSEHVNDYQLYQDIMRPNIIVGK